MKTIIRKILKEETKIEKFRNYIIDDLISKTTIEKNTGGWDVYMITTPFGFAQFFGEESIDSEISPNRLFILSYLNKFYGIEKPKDLISIINSYKDRILEIILEKRQSDNT